MPLVEAVDISARCVGELLPEEKIKSEIQESVRKKGSWHMGWWNKSANQEIANSDDSSSDEEFVVPPPPKHLLRWSTYPKLQDSWQPEGSTFVALGTVSSPELACTDAGNETSESDSESDNICAMNGGNFMSSSASLPGPADRGSPSTDQHVFAPTTSVHQPGQVDVYSLEDSTGSPFLNEQDSTSHGQSNESVTMQRNGGEVDVQSQGTTFPPVCVRNEAPLPASPSPEETAECAEGEVSKKTSEESEVAEVSGHSEPNVVADVRKGFTRFRVASKAKGKLMADTTAKGGLGFINQTVTAAGSLPDSLAQMARKKETKLHWLETLTSKELKAELNIAKPVALDSEIPDRGRLW